MTRPPEVSRAADVGGVMAALATAPITARGFLANASNHTLLVQVGDPAGDGIHAVYKPLAGERPLWDFPEGTLHLREVAAYEVSSFLGWDLVPPTVLRDGPHGAGSVQLFVAHDPQRHYFTFVDEAVRRDELARIAYFDLLVNNADRKGGHILLDEGTGRLVGIDHGLTFHAAPKLRSVVWDLRDARVADVWRDDVARLHAALEEPPDGGIAERLAALLSPDEVQALRRRAGALQDLRRLPDPPVDRRPYPWPPL